MELALSGLNPQFNATAAIEPTRQRQSAQQEAQQPSSARNTNDRAAEEQQNRSRAENNSRTPDTARVINGEVLSSETTRVNPREASRDSGSTFNARSSFNQQPNNQTENRRISAQQAIQTFQENEDIVSDSSNPRQVSGIIDEFV